MAKVLIIDDDEAMCRMLAGMVHDMGHQAEVVHSRGEGVENVSENDYDVVFLDVRLPDGSGLDILPDIRQSASTPDVVVMTGHGDADGAEIAITNGAWDYLQKPLSPKKIVLPLSRVLQHRDEKAKEKPKALALKEAGIIGQSPVMNACYDLIAQSSGSKANVLITGETGTGKDLFARAIHENSRRSTNRFVIVDCAALPGTLVESVLFGHVKGAFTGADREREGLIKQADNGTLFLDEIGELPLAIQKAFLRVLQERYFRPVGSKNVVHSNFRLLCATNKNLEKMVTAGKFREDLLYRIKAVTIGLPSLREHKEDIHPISMFHINKICGRSENGQKGCSPEFLQALERYDWPGNVRELVNALENAVASSGRENTLLAVHLPVHIRIQSARASINPQSSLPTEGVRDSLAEAVIPGYRKLMNETERSYLKELISHTKGDIKRCCHISGLSRSRIYALLKKHSIRRTYG